MVTVVEFLIDDELVAAEVGEQDKRKLIVTELGGRTTRLAPDKVLFRHTASSIEALLAAVAALAGDIDVALLWEALLAEEHQAPRQARELARVYYDVVDDLHASAIFRALLDKQLYFRRKGVHFEPRAQGELERLREQRSAEARVARELEELTAALRAPQVDAALAQRLERHLRRGEDRQLSTALAAVAKDPARHAFGLLVRGGYMPDLADLELVQANLQKSPRQSALDHAAGLSAPVAAGGAVSPAMFTIDDPETLEVDDALSVCRDQDLFRVDVDIADVGALVRAGDPVDHEALRRASTVYVPTGTYYMLPERLGTDLLSLTRGLARKAMRTSVWLDAAGRVQRYELVRCFVEVQTRLNYDAADELLQHGQDASADALRTLHGLARALYQRRKDSGALSFRQREWRIQVSADGKDIAVRRVALDSPSRMLVAEFMILINGLAAKHAAEAGVPVIYRVQAPPSQPPPDVDPDDPAAFIKLRGVLSPATLSLKPSRHFGLGLAQYTQASSPLRRFTDLVIQRQLGAVLDGQPPVYRADELLRMLASAENTEREFKRIETAVNARWALEYVARQLPRKPRRAWVLEPVTGGYRVELEDCGARGALLTSARHETGELVWVHVKTVKPRHGTMRLLPAG